MMVWAGWIWCRRRNTDARFSCALAGFGGQALERKCLPGRVQKAWSSPPPPSSGRCQGTFPSRTHTAVNPGSRKTHFPKLGSPFLADRFLAFLIFAQASYLFPSSAALPLIICTTFYFTSSSTRNGEHFLDRSRLCFVNLLFLLDTKTRSTVIVASVKPLWGGEFSATYPDTEKLE